MAYLSANTPKIKCFIRNEFLYNQEKGHGDFTPCYIFGVTALEQRALVFTCMLETGAQFARMPIHAFAHREGAKRQPLGKLELWDALSYNFTCIQYSYLKGLDGNVFLGDRSEMEGSYVCTLDFCDNDQERLASFSETPDEHKTAHLMALEDGNFALQPNNRILWKEQSFIVKELDGKPDYKTNTHYWNAEGAVTEDSDAYYYEIRENVRKQRELAVAEASVPSLPEDGLQEPGGREEREVLLSGAQPTCGAV